MNKKVMTILDVRNALSELAGRYEGFCQADTRGDKLAAKTALRKYYRLGNTLLNEFRRLGMPEWNDGCTIKRNFEGRDIDF